jgi:predicted secreted hydrolase
MSARGRLAAIAVSTLLAVATAALSHRSAAAATAEKDSAGWRLALAPYTFHFPRDHFAHPEYRTEWWYVTGHLAGEGRRFGYELTFFRVGVDLARRSSPSAWAPHTLYFAHLALTDENASRFHFADRAGRPALGMSGADTAGAACAACTCHVWIDDWSMAIDPDGRHHLRANAPDFGISLDLEPQKPPAIHGIDGVSVKGEGHGNASHYYSYTRLVTSGDATVERRTLRVSGRSWMDHEWSTSGLAANEAGWDWFALQLDDGRDLMLYVMRLTNGGIEPHSSGTLVDANGHARHLERDAFRIEATGEWKSPESGATYPSGWKVRIPSEDLALDLTPTVRDQELRTASSTGVTYWEGSVGIQGTSRGRPVRGEGYVELTGYTGGPPGR